VPRPWISRAQEPGVHGRIADSGSPQSRLERRKCWSAGVTRAERAGCKTVGSAYAGSNPTPATTCENGPLAVNSRLGGPFPSCHAVCHLVALWTGVSRCPRTYSGRRPGRQDGRCAPSAVSRTATDGPRRRRVSRLDASGIRARRRASVAGLRAGRHGAAIAPGWTRLPLAPWPRGHFLRLTRRRCLRQGQPPHHRNPVMATHLFARDAGKGCKT